MNFMATATFWKLCRRVGLRKSPEVSARHGSLVRIDRIGRRVGSHKRVPSPWCDPFHTLRPHALT